MYGYFLEVLHLFHAAADCFCSIYISWTGELQHPLKLLLSRHAGTGCNLGEVEIAGLINQLLCSCGDFF